jgi:exosortase
MGLLHELLQYSLDNKSSSHILLIPLVSAVLVYQRRDDIFPCSRWGVWLGSGLMAAALVMIVAAIPGSSVGYTDSLSIKTSSGVVLLLGCFALCYGTASFHAALFPLLFLFLTVPLPEEILSRTTALLQRGSADAAALLFRVSGTPFLRDGFFFSLPGVRIEIAEQCSGIRSSLAVFITCLVAGYLMLKTGWRRALLVALSIPMAVFKNAVRIVTLSLLAIHVDMGFLADSNLHTEGGILFYLLALLLMTPVFWILRKAENPAEGARPPRGTVLKLS